MHKWLVTFPGGAQTQHELQAILGDYMPRVLAYLSPVLSDGKQLHVHVHVSGKEKEACTAGSGFVVGGDSDRGETIGWDTTTTTTSAGTSHEQSVVLSSVHVTQTCCVLLQVVMKDNYVMCMR